MIKDIAQVQSAPLTNLRLTHFMGLMTYTRDQWLAAFDADHPAPGKLPGQFGEFTGAYDVLNRAYQADKYSLDTERLKRADEDCDHTYMGVKKMVQAQQAFDFNQPVKEAADEMMVCIDKYGIDVQEDYLGENNKLQQLLEEISGSPALEAAAQTLGITGALAQLEEKVTLVRTLLTQRGMAKPTKGQMKAAS